MDTLHTEPLSTKDCLLDWFKLNELELARHNNPEKTRLLSENVLARRQKGPAAILTRGTDAAAGLPASGGGMVAIAG